MMALTVDKATSTFDFDRLAADPKLELWAIRIPDGVCPVLIVVGKRRLISRHVVDSSLVVLSSSRTGLGSFPLSLNPRTSPTSSSPFLPSLHPPPPPPRSLRLVPLLQSTRRTRSTMLPPPRPAATSSPPSDLFFPVDPKEVTSSPPGPSPPISSLPRRPPPPPPPLPPSPPKPPPPSPPPPLSPPSPPPPRRQRSPSRDLSRPSSRLVSSRWTSSSSGTSPSVPRVPPPPHPSRSRRRRPLRPPRLEGYLPLLLRLFLEERRRRARSARWEKPFRLLRKEGLPVGKVTRARRRRRRRRRTLEHDDETAFFSP